HCYFVFQAEDGIRDFHVTGVQTCALPISTTPPACTSTRRTGRRRRRSSPGPASRSTGRPASGTWRRPATRSAGGTASWTAPGPSPTTPRSRSPRPRRSGTSAGSRGPAPRRDPARERQADAGRLVRGGRGVRPVVVATPAGPRPGHGDRGSRLVEGPPAPD